MDYKELKSKLAAELQAKQPERRAHVRVRMRVILKLRGAQAQGGSFEVSAATDNMSAGGFLCSSSETLPDDAGLDVYLTGPQSHLAGRAKVTRKNSPGTAWQQYALQFTEKTTGWIL